MKKNKLWVKNVQEKVEERQEEEEKKKKIAKIVSAISKIISYTPPKGLFTKSPQVIATQLKKDSKDLKQAMSRLNFYINRAGGNLTTERSKALEKAKDILRGLYGKKESALDSKPPKAWWDRLVREVKKNNPSYSKDIVEKTVGNIWHNQLSDYRKKKLIDKYE